MDNALHNMNIHENLRHFRQDDPEYKAIYTDYLKKYPLAAK